MKFTLDADTFDLIHLLLRKETESCADYRRYSNLQSKMIFTIGNRALHQLNCTPVDAQPEEPKK